MKQRRTAARLRCVSLRKYRFPCWRLPLFFFSARSSAAWSPRAARRQWAASCARYLEGYLALRIEGAPSSAAVWQTMVCFFRASVAVFLLGFASVGVALIPAVCAAQGFLYAYSLLCFASGLGQDGFFLLPVLFALRLMLVLPCTLLLGSAAWETSRGLAALSVAAESGRRA